MNGNSSFLVNSERIAVTNAALMRCDLADCRFEFWISGSCASKCDLVVSSVVTNSVPLAGGLSDFTMMRLSAAL